MDSGFDAAILTYHSISAGPAPLCTPLPLFASQMSWLKSNANVVPLSDLVDCFHHSHKPPRRTVALTFDDGFADFDAAAAPVLRQLGLHATVFMPVSYAGRTACWDAKAGGQPLLTWNQIRKLSSQGIIIGSHSLTHPPLTSLSDAELAPEIAESKKMIEKETGQEPRFFCYPYGRFDERTRRAVRDHYAAACTTSLRLLSPEEDPLALPRIDVHYLRNPRMFRSLFTRELRLYLYVRRLLRETISRLHQRDGRRRLHIEGVSG